MTALRAGWEYANKEDEQYWISRERDEYKYKRREHKRLRVWGPKKSDILECVPHSFHAAKKGSFLTHHRKRLTRKVVETSPHTGYDIIIMMLY